MRGELGKRRIKREARRKRRRKRRKMMRNGRKRRKKRRKRRRERRKKMRTIGMIYSLKTIKARTFLLISVLFLSGFQQFK